MKGGKGGRLAEEKVKVAIWFETSNPGEYEVETVWADPTPEGYQIDNIPFYALSIAYRDIVAAVPNANGQLEYRGLVRASGHSTIRVLIATGEDVPSIRDELRSLGCPSELSDHPRLIAVDVPPSIPYSRIRAVLDDGERKGRFEFEEGCLGQTAEEPTN